MRHPLQTGATMLRRLLITTLVVAVAAALFGLSNPPDVYGFNTRSGLFAWEWLFLSPVTALILHFLVGKARASDCEFSEKGFKVLGGAFDQLEVAYRTIQPETTAIYAGRVVLDIGDGVKLPVASASVEAEQRSLEAFLGTLTLRSRQQSSAAAGESESLTPSQPEVLRCAGCGTPVVVDDVPEVVCESCRQNVVIAEDLRVKLRAARSLGTQQLAVADLVRRALRQPSAKRINQVLIVVATLGVVWLPVPIVLRELAMTVGSVVLLSLAYWFAYALIASRRALTVFIAEHSARRNHGLYYCCDCGAPLPHTQEDDLVAQCVYCDAHNVLGFDYAREAAQTDETRRSLSEAYAAHRRALARARVKAVTAALATCIAFALFLRTGDGSAEDNKSNRSSFETTCNGGNCRFAGLDGDSRQVLAALAEQNTDLTLHVAPNARISELAEVAALAHIRELYVDQPMTEFDPAVLQRMKFLSILRIQGATLSSLQPLAGLPLRSLNLSDSKLCSLEGVHSLLQLESFYCYRCASLVDLSPFTEHPRLTRLAVGGSGIRSITALVGVPQLRMLGISNTQVTDFTPIQSLPQLESLDLLGCKINSVQTLGSLPQLRELKIDSSVLVRQDDLSQFRGLAKLCIEEHAPAASEESLRKALPNTEVLEYPCIKVSDVVSGVNNIDFSFLHKKK